MITGIFQILWAYYGLLILSRPVVVWNMMAVLINSLSVGAYYYFLKRDEQANVMSDDDWRHGLICLSHGFNCQNISISPGVLVRLDGQGALCL